MEWVNLHVSWPTYAYISNGAFLDCVLKMEHGKNYKTINILSTFILNFLDLIQGIFGEGGYGEEISLTLF